MVLMPRLLNRKLLLSAIWFFYLNPHSLLAITKLLVMLLFICCVLETKNPTTHTENQHKNPKNKLKRKSIFNRTTIIQTFLCQNFLGFVLIQHMHLTWQVFYSKKGCQTIIATTAFEIHHLNNHAFCFSSLSWLL